MIIFGHELIFSEEKSQDILALEFEHIYISLYRALHTIEVNIVTYQPF